MGLGGGWLLLLSLWAKVVMVLKGEVAFASPSPWPAKNFCPFFGPPYSSGVDPRMAKFPRPALLVWVVQGGRKSRAVPAIPRGARCAARHLSATGLDVPVLLLPPYVIQLDTSVARLHFSAGECGELLFLCRGP